MITLTDYQFGPESRDRRAEAKDPTADGAIAALETFYYALNQHDTNAMTAVWSPHELAQLNNPVGGILRSGKNAVALYQRIFDSGMQLEITFSDATTYLEPTTAVFAGRETGIYAPAGKPASPLEIRTSRFFHYDQNAGRWVQLHHHGSIDDPDALRAYQLAVKGD